MGEEPSEPDGPVPGDEGGEPDERHGRGRLPPPPAGPEPDADADDRGSGDAQQ